MDLVKLSALKDDGFRSMVVGSVAIIGVAPLGWLGLMEPTTIYTTILSIAGLVIGKDVTGRVADAVKKAKEGQ